MSDSLARCAAKSNKLNCTQLTTRNGPSHIGSNPSRTEFWVKGKKRREEQTVGDLRPRAGGQHSAGLAMQLTARKGGAARRTWLSPFSGGSPAQGWHLGSPGGT